MILFFDTETTGFYDRNLPPDHKGQPHIVQLAAVLAEEKPGEGAFVGPTLVERACISLIISPDGYSIPDAASAVHGITDDIAKACGVPLSAAMKAFVALTDRCEMRVAHNLSFDVGLVATACYRIGIEHDQANRLVDALGIPKGFCTMEAATPIMNLPPTERMKAAGMDKPKPPKLEDAYLHFTGEPMQNAHDALADVRGCMEVFRRLRALGAAQ